MTDAAFDRLMKAQRTYNNCGVCGHQPYSRSDEPNRSPLRWWDPDDGWKIGTLCHGCAEEVLDRTPQPGDYAYPKTNGVCDGEPETDECPLGALL